MMFWIYKDGAALAWADVDLDEIYRLTEGMSLIEGKEGEFGYIGFENDEEFDVFLSRLWQKKGIK
jgi:hypothetical protein